MLPLRLSVPSTQHFVNSAMNAKTPHGNSEGVNFRKSSVNFLGGLAFLADFEECICSTYVFHFSIFPRMSVSTVS